LQVNEKPLAQGLGRNDQRRSVTQACTLAMA
jgi:hypothetical protein